MKVCNFCDRAKEVTLFYKSKSNKDGYANKCKMCWRSIKPQIEKRISLDTKKMHHDIIIKLCLIKKPQRYITEKLGFSRATFWRMSKGKAIDIETFLSISNWLDVSLDKYVIKE